MTSDDVVHLRLTSQQLASPRFSDPAALVEALGPVQAQDYAAGVWAVGLRLRGEVATRAPAIEAALASGAIVRTHPLRGTLHLVAATDVRWILGLTADRQRHKATARHLGLGIDRDVQRRATAALGKALRGGVHLDRAQVAAVLARANIATNDERLVHLIFGAELDLAIVSGARRGKQHTFAAFDERIPASPARPRDEALAALARIYFQARGPATLADFTWWSGLPPRECRSALASIADELEPRGDLWMAKGLRAAKSRSRALLLPGWDEYTVAYKDRSAVQSPRAKAIANRYGILAPVATLDGIVVGTWGRRLEKQRATVRIELLEALPRAGLAAIEAAAADYAAFLGAPLALEVT